MIKLSEKFIIDQQGRRQSVIIPYRKYEELLENYHDLKLIADRKNEPVSSFDDFKKELEQDGLL